MEHLSGLDASFLHLETRDMPMHVGALMLLDVPAEKRSAFPERLRQFMASRLHVSPVFSRKLAQVVLDLANPVWVAADEHDLAAHLHHHTLPAPGGMRELEHYVARVHATPLDRSRPLWEMHVIDDAGEGALALYVKIHHAALDGVGASALMRMLLEADPGGKPAAVPLPEAHPGAAALLSASVGRALGQAVCLARQVPGGLRALASLRSKLPFLAPRTALNTSITAERSFTTLQFPLDDIAAAARAFNGTVNDAVLAMVSDALRRYMTQSSSLPAGSLVAAVPVNLRERAGGHVSNHASVWQVGLATDIDDFAERMHAIVRNTHDMRAAVDSARPLMLTDFPGIGMPWLMGGLAAIVGRMKLADTLPPLANLVVSNVPGPAQPLHIAGAQVLAAYPLSIVTHGLALNVTVQSYAGMLHVGIVAATSAVPDLPQFAEAMRDAHAELLAHGHRGPAEPAGARPTRTKVSRKRRPHAPEMHEDVDEAPVPHGGNGQRAQRGHGRVRTRGKAASPKAGAPVTATTSPSRRLRAVPAVRGA